MRKQLRLNTNLGKDTHVRDHTSNIFTRANHEIYQTLIGEIAGVSQEPIYKQTTVSVELARGGKINAVAYPGAFIDPVTGNLHGTYEGPIEGQMVVIGFENGNSNSPYVINRYPYQGRGNTLTEQAYINPLTKKGFHANDVLLGHFSGSYMSFNTGIAPSVKLPGSITVNSVNDFELLSGANILLDAILSAEVKSDIVKIYGTTHIELNGNSDNAINYAAMKTAFDQLKSDFNNFLYHTHVTSGTTSSNGTAVPPLSMPSTADMAPAKNEKVLL
jgi:hypothetical protein